METVLALAAAALYGSADFLGGTASRRASTFAVLAVPPGARLPPACAGWAMPSWQEWRSGCSSCSSATLGQPG